jgi:hypothetical protein
VGSAIGCDVGVMEMKRAQFSLRAIFLRIAALAVSLTIFIYLPRSVWEEAVLAMRHPGMFYEAIPALLGIVLMAAAPLAAYRFGRR